MHAFCTSLFHQRYQQAIWPSLIFVGQCEFKNALSQTLPCGITAEDGILTFRLLLGWWPCVRPSASDASAVNLGHAILDTPLGRREYKRRPSWLGPRACFMLIATHCPQQAQGRVHPR